MENAVSSWGKVGYILRRNLLNAFENFCPFYMKSFAAILLGLSSLPAVGITVADAYQSALSRTETAQIAEARVRQSDARVSQAWAGFFPNLTFGASYQHQHNNGTGSATGIAFSGAQSFSRLTLTQSIFEGGRDTAALSGSKAARTAQEQNLAATKLRVFATVANSFYALLSTAREIENIQKTMKLATARVKELKTPTGIGRSRKIELLAAEAQLSVLQSQPWRWTDSSLPSKINSHC